MPSVPVIDIARLRSTGQDPSASAAIDAACRSTGFFGVVGHGVDPALRARLDSRCREFFALPSAEKARIAMAHGGRAWRGWFPVGSELTSGTPDAKEGLYFGSDLTDDDPRVRAGLPLHGPNLYPGRPVELADAVRAYMSAVTEVGQTLLRGMAVGLGLPPDWFARTLTAEPTVLFRVFRYPPLAEAPTGPSADSVGEHTDYGLLTLLGQDGNPGLEVLLDDAWTDVPADPDTLVVNLGDMLELMTGRRYRSTVHRVRNHGRTDRLSYPLFLDPGWDTVVTPVPGAGAAPGAAEDRWDGEDPLDWTGTYGDYLWSRVARVFPELADDVT